MAKMFLMCGKCGSGKSYFAKQFAKGNNCRYLGIDECYGILNGDERIRENKFDAWQLFYRRIHNCEVLGQDVVIDTNAPFTSDRQEFLNWFNFDKCTLIWIDATDAECWHNNLDRERSIPKDHFDKVNGMFTPPCKEEPSGRRSWDEILKFENNGEPDICDWDCEKIL